jgi:hypothetical protein
MRRHLGNARERLLRQDFGKKDPQRSAKRKSISRKTKPRSSQK